MNTNIGSPMDLFVLQRACKDWIDINRRSMYFYVTSFLSMLCLNFPSFNMYNVIHVWLDFFHTSGSRKFSARICNATNTLLLLSTVFSHSFKKQYKWEKKGTKLVRAKCLRQRKLLRRPHLLRIIIFSWNWAWALSHKNIKMSSPSPTLCFILLDKWWNFQNMCRGKLPLMLTGGRATLQACEDRG